MLSHHDELELLAIIEGELDDERLSHDPQVRALVQQMKRDRETLRSEPEPQMPHDLAAKIEQALTRPMLIAAWGEDETAAEAASHAGQRSAHVPRPGEFRRHHHRPARLRRALRLAMAACIAIFLLGGLWLGIDAASDWRLERQERLAQREAEASIIPGDAGSVAAGDEPWPPAGAIIHHYGPQPVLESYMAARSTSGSPSEADTAVASEPIAVEFALFITGTESSAVEEALTAAVAAHGQSASLIRHMSQAEARRIVDEFRASAEDDGTRPQARPNARSTSRPLAGSRVIDPDFGQQQLDYAVRGATHTITIRLSQLSGLLAEVERSALPGQLHPMPSLLQADRGSSTTRDWVKSRAMVRRALAELEAAGDDPLIHLPVVLESN